jgi:hypothetical protein
MSDLRGRICRLLKSAQPLSMANVKRFRVHNATGCPGAEKRLGSRWVAILRSCSLSVSW